MENENMQTHAIHPMHKVSPLIIKQRSFTLIELLITIAIIVILAGLLLPSLKKAREQGLRISCASNMKQIYLGFMGYADSYSDYMPPAVYNSWDSTIQYRISWLSLFYPFINGKTFDASQNTTTQAIICPAGKSETLSNLPSKPLSNYLYCVYLGLLDPAYGYPTYPLYGAHRLSKCPQPAASPILIDGKAATLARLYYEINSPATALTQADIRHLSAINALFADGHIERDKILSHSDTEIKSIYRWINKWTP